MYFDPKSRVQHAREAKRWAERAHDLDPMGVGANAMSIYLYWVEADYIGALAQTDRSLQTLPNDLATPTFRAVALSALGRTAEALVYFRQATQIDPLNIFAITNEIFALSDLRRAEQALRLMTASRAAIAADDTKLAFFDERMAYARLQLLGEFPSAQGVIPNSNWAAWCWIARDFAGVEKAATAALSTGDLSPGERFENLQIRHDSLKRLGRTDDAASVLVEMREAARFIQDEEEFGPSSKAGWLAKVEVRAGRIDAGLAAAQQYLEAAPLGTHPRLHWSRQIDVAELLAYLNRPEECAALLAPLLRVASGLTVPRLKADPVWDPVRNSAAFKALLADPKNNEPLF
jgi:tetratricopeptide (TPR) repeat protein